MHPLKATDFLRYALDNPNPDTEFKTIGECYIESARQNDKRPAYVKLMVPDDWIKNIRGTAELQDIYMLCHFPREMWERFKSPILMDGEVKL